MDPIRLGYGDWYYMLCTVHVAGPDPNLFHNLKMDPVLTNRIRAIPKRSTCAMCLAEMSSTITKEACHPCFNPKISRSPSSA